LIYGKIATQKVRFWPILLKKSPLKVCEILYVLRRERFRKT